MLLKNNKEKKKKRETRNMSDETRGIKKITSQKIIRRCTFEFFELAELLALASSSLRQPLELPRSSSSFI